MPELLHVRSTVNLPGLYALQEAMVDPERPVIREYLRVGYLVPVELNLGSLAVLEAVGAALAAEGNPDSPSRSDGVRAAPVALQEVV